MNIIEIGKRVRRARRKAGMSQAELARAVGYSAANPISKLESGKFATVDIRLLYRIADVTGVTVAFLVGDATVELAPNPEEPDPGLYSPEPDWQGVKISLDRMSRMLEELVERTRRLDAEVSRGDPADLRARTPVVPDGRGKGESLSASVDREV